MGFIRLFLAVAVAAGHSGGFPNFTLLPGFTAVQSFYIISGFYMALILNEKYVKKEGSYRLFISSRLLRLLPLYWVSLIAAITAAIFAGRYLEYELSTFPAALSRDLSLGTKLYVALSNLLILGQDLAMFLGVDKTDGSLFFTANFAATEIPAHRLLLVPQGWSLSIEMLFYILAPFLVTRSRNVLLLVLAASFGSRLSLYSFGYSFDPWTYRFFPNELALFLWGALAYRWYAGFRSSPPTKLLLFEVYAILLLLMLMFPFFLREWPGLRVCGFLFVLGASLPFIFILSKDWAFDRMLGELSYPVYLIHLSITWLAVAFLGASRGTASLIVVPSSIVAAYLMHKFIMSPLEVIRQKRVDSARTRQ